MTNRVLLLTLLFTCGASALAPTVRAQESQDINPDGAPNNAEAETEGPIVRAPELLRFYSAVYPAEAEAAGIEAVVELSLTIDATGMVTDATVQSAAGHGFDEAAVAAVQQFVFAPATRDDEAIASRIGYRYVFELTTQQPPPVVPEANSPEELESEPGRLTGRVLSREDDEPLAGAEVIVTSGDASVALRATSDESGQFTLDSMLPGDYEISVFLDGFDSFSVPEAIESGNETSVTYRLESVRATVGFQARAVVEAPPREVVRRRITREELLRVPGTRGDALRTVELLPGVGRPAFGTGQLLVRGSGPNDSEVFLDGVAVPLLYHFGGLTSFFNSQLLEQIDFVPGNFSVRYGRKVGGILEVESRSPALDDIHGVVDINLIDASMLLEAPISEDLSFAVAARRSYIDFWFENVIPGDVFDVVTAPVYYDYQAELAWDASDDDRLRFLFYGSSDRFNVVFSDPSDTDPNLRGDLDLRTQFHKFFVEWDHKINRDVDQQVQLSVGPTLLNFAFGQAIRFDATFWEVALRSEWRTRISERVQLRSGLDINWVPFSLEYTGPPIQQQEGTGQQDPITGQEIQNVDVTGSEIRPAVYAEADLLPIDGLRLVMGVRLDWYSEIDAWSVDPRLVSLVTIDGKNRIKFGAGMFSQPPEFQETAEDLGNPNLRPFRALHLGLGYERDFEEGVRAGMELFYKYLWDRPISDTPQNGGGFINGGVGQIYGLELSGRIEPQGRRYFGFLSYTFSRSERRDLVGTPWRLFDFDQTHILAASFTYMLGDGWELGGTFRLVSGNPQTPAVPFGRLNINSGVVNAINGAINSERAPFFHRLDIRIAKKWEFEDWDLTLYLDLQNSYNSTNPEGIIYDWRYVNRSDVPGLPIIPSLGVRGQL